VTNASGTTALEDIEACAWSVGGGGPSPRSPTEGCTLTNGSGEYTIKGLAVGSYRVEFSAFVCGPKACEQRQNYLNQYYDEKTSDSQAESVSVTVGNTTPAIDAKMAEGGQISGRVTSAATHSPQAGIYVCPRADEQNNESGNCVKTNTAGEYMISGLIAGSYNVNFSSGWEGPNYLPQYFSGKSISSEATAVPVSAGHVSAGVNAELQAGGEITGRVTSAATHVGLAAISVCAEHSVSTPESCVHTNAAGEYRIAGLNSGSPSVLFSKGESDDVERTPDYAAWLTGLVRGARVEVWDGAGHIVDPNGSRHAYGRYSPTRPRPERQAAFLGTLQAGRAAATAPASARGSRA
jgi:hypothetical protein